MTGIIKKITRNIFGAEFGSDLFASYAGKGVIQLLLLHVFSMAFVFILNYLLIRVAGVADYGGYVYLFNLLSLLVGFTVMGTDTLLLKENGLYDHDRNYGLLKGVIYFSIGITLIGSLIAGLFTTILAGRFNMLSSVGDKYQLLFFIVLPVMSLAALIQASLQGLKKIFLSQVGDKVIRPALVIIVLVIIYFLKKKPDLSQLILINSAAISFSFLIGLILHNKIIIPLIKNARPVFRSSAWIRSSFGFFLLNMLVVISSRVDIFLLGIFGEIKQVGVYNIILKLSEIIGFSLFVINFVIAPLIPRMIYRNEKEQLQKIVTQTARFIFVVSVPLVFFIILFRFPILDFFGVDMYGASTALIILCCGQLVNVLLGSVGLLLLMSGNQKYSILSLGIGVFINIVLNIILIPLYGIIGVAIASAFGLVTWNLLMYYFVRKKMNLYTTAFNRIKN